MIAPIHLENLGEVSLKLNSLKIASLLMAVQLVLACQTSRRGPRAGSESSDLSETAAVVITQAELEKHLAPSALSDPSAEFVASLDWSSASLAAFDSIDKRGMWLAHLAPDGRLSLDPGFPLAANLSGCLPFVLDSDFRYFALQTASDASWGLFGDVCLDDSGRVKEWRFESDNCGALDCREALFEYFAANRDAAEGLLLGGNKGGKKGSTSVKGNESNHAPQQAGAPQEPARNGVVATVEVIQSDEDHQQGDASVQTQDRKWVVATVESIQPALTRVDSARTSLGILVSEKFKPIVDGIYSEVANFVFQISSKPLGEGTYSKVYAFPTSTFGEPVVIRVTTDLAKDPKVSSNDHAADVRSDHSKRLEGMRALGNSIDSSYLAMPYFMARVGNANDPSSIRLVAVYPRALGDVTQMMTKNKEYRYYMSSPKNRRRAYQEILTGLSQLHDVGARHCDLKPPNILVYADGAGYVHKVADLDGTIVLTGNYLQDSKIASLGTRGYVSGDFLERGDLADMRRIDSHEAFSAGITFLEMEARLYMPADLFFSQKIAKRIQTEVGVVEFIKQLKSLLFERGTWLRNFDQPRVKDFWRARVDKLVQDAWKNKWLNDEDPEEIEQMKIEEKQANQRKYTRRKGFSFERQIYWLGLIRMALDQIPKNNKIDLFSVIAKEMRLDVGNFGVIHDLILPDYTKRATVESARQALKNIDGLK